MNKLRIIFDSLQVPYLEETVWAVIYLYFSPQICLIVPIFVIKTCTTMKQRNALLLKTFHVEHDKKSKYFLSCCRTIPVQIRQKAKFCLRLKRDNQRRRRVTFAQQKLHQFKFYTVIAWYDIKEEISFIWFKVVIEIMKFCSSLHREGVWACKIYFQTWCGKELRNNYETYFWRI